ncbi:MarR family transcriptional regulator [Micromonospora polyrhachis]|uniref:Putative transcriptional regulator n=1 Tax=Micromonospora polyrhachis TaxID=1282883 RepID=A0A7W7WPF4_9ACTN|nr:MarR family transcriptional regulator [Micromonospora polyrhachis]MBB4958639.1 putative transcriptional regulator [Micromonospora polyrhachis]
MSDPSPPRRDDEAVDRFVERMAMLFANWGFPRMAARVLFAVMSADEEALTAAEIGERLGVSPAAISGAVRYLTHRGLLVREPIPRSRRDHYRMPDDPWFEAAVVKRSALTVMADLTSEGAKAVGGDETPSGERLAEMRDYLIFAQDEVDSINERWRAHRAANRSPSPGE